MPNDGQKVAFARSMEQFANRKITGAMAALGQSLPASVVSRTGGIVTVKFEIATTPNSPYTLPNIKVPLVGAEFARAPIGAGTKGFVITADAYLGGMSGLGGGVADLSPRGNLSMLVWTPIGNTAWMAAIDDNAYEAYGPNGVNLYNTAKTAILKVTTAECSITPPIGNPFIVNGNLVVTGNIQLAGTIEAQAGGTYAGNITTSGNVIAGSGGADQVGLQTHEHSANNTPPTPGT
jgi:hypothetical protein